MDSGIVALIEFDRSDICPVVEISDIADTRIDAVTRSVCTDGCQTATSEFVVEQSAIDSAELDSVEDDALAVVFSRGSFHRYRLQHSSDQQCPCECIGSMGCPVSRYVADAGTLRVEFCAADFAELQELVADLRDAFPVGELKRLIRSPSREHTSDVVQVDRQSLTPRQLEVLRSAHEMGYFEPQGGANASEIAEELGVHPSTVSEHLALAQAKLLNQVL